MTPTKLIEVALPLLQINAAAVKELQNPFLKGHPKGLKWWARLPLATSRAVVFASLVDDPSAHPESFPTVEAQASERERLFRLIGSLVSDIGAPVAKQALSEIQASARDQLPMVIDPFAGGGSIPLEARRLGLGVAASDLNPIAVLINETLLSLPARFVTASPVSGRGRLPSTSEGIKGLSEDLRTYGRLVEEAARQRLEEVYPAVTITGFGSQKSARPSAWLWARTARCPNPVCGSVVPLLRSLVLSRRKGRESWLGIEGNPGDDLLVNVRTGPGWPNQGTVRRAGPVCPACRVPMPFSYVRAEGQAGRLGSRLVAIVAEANGRKWFVDANSAQITAAELSPPTDGIPETRLPERALGFRVQAYGLNTHASLFAPRQLVALREIAALIKTAHTDIERDSISAGFIDDGVAFADGGSGARAYADAIVLLLTQAFGRTVMFHNTLCKWNVTNENITSPFSLQTLSMSWDYVEANPVEGSLSFATQCSLVADIVEANGWAAQDVPALVDQLDAAKVMPGSLGVVITDPPYYDNVGYAQLADFFYVWYRLILTEIYPDFMSTIGTPKQEELIADTSQKDVEAAREKFRKGLRDSFKQMRMAQHGEYPFSVFYAFKQSEETDEGSGRVSTGWEVMLSGLVDAGFHILRTWPLQTVRPSRTRGQASNALSSSVLLVCRKRPDDAPMSTRSEFVSKLRSELPATVKELQRLNIPPVDAAQAAIGPGMAVFSRYSKVKEADGSDMSIRSALALINQILDEILTEQEGDFDAETRWAVSWYEQFGLNEGEFGRADDLARARNTAVNALVEAGVVVSRGGKVRLLDRDELPDEWDPATDRRLSVWEITQHLVKALDHSEQRAGDLMRRIGGLGETARELSYRLYVISDRKGWAKEALSYNGLVVAWPGLARLSTASSGPLQQSLTSE
jgi:putative DNA methylase